MKLIWTDPGLADFEAIHTYISRDSETYAIEFAEHIITSAERLTRFPRLGRVVPEADDEHFRELILRSYRLIYGVQGDASKSWQSCMAGESCG